MKSFSSRARVQINWWIADVTYILERFLFLAIVLKVFSRRIVGWAIANHLRTELVLEALEMPIW